MKLGLVSGPVTTKNVTATPRGRLLMDSDLGCTACSGWGLATDRAGRCRCCHGTGFHLASVTCHSHTPLRARLRRHRTATVVGLAQPEARLGSSAVTGVLYHHEGTRIR